MERYTISYGYPHWDQNISQPIRGRRTVTAEDADDALGLFWKETAFSPVIVTITRVDRAEDTA
jgi:hypothetical protein